MWSTHTNTTQLILPTSNKATTRVVVVTLKNSSVTKRSISSTLGLTAELVSKTFS